MNSDRFTICICFVLLFCRTSLLPVQNTKKNQQQRKDVWTLIPFKWVFLIVGVKCSSWRQRLLWKITQRDYCLARKLKKGRIERKQGNRLSFRFMLCDSHWVLVVWMKMKNFRNVLILFGQHFEVNWYVFVPVAVHVCMDCVGLVEAIKPIFVVNENAFEVSYGIEIPSQRTDALASSSSLSPMHFWSIY